MHNPKPVALPMPRTLFIGMKTELTGQRQRHRSVEFQYLGCTTRSELDAELDMFNALLERNMLWRHASEEVSRGLGFLDATMLDKVVERHRYRELLAEDRRALMLGAVGFWMEFLRRRNFSLLVYGTYSPHWVWNLALATAARMLGVRQYALAGDFISRRINLMDLQGIDVVPLSSRHHDIAGIRNFCMEQAGGVHHPAYVAAYLRPRSHARNFHLSALLTGLREMRKNVLQIRARRTHLQFVDYDASALRQAARKFVFDLRLSWRTHRLHRSYMRATAALRREPARADVLLAQPKVAVFFANYQPEATTTPDAGHFTNSKLVVAELVRRGFTVLYKEHPVTFVSSIAGNTNKSPIYKGEAFYAELQASGAHLLPEDFDNDRILSFHPLVVTCTGTIALQAACRGERVLILGRSWFGRPPGVFGSFDELQDTGRPPPSLEGVVAYLEERWARSLPNVIGSMTGQLAGGPDDVEDFFEQVARQATAVEPGRLEAA